MGTRKGKISREVIKKAKPAKVKPIISVEAVKAVHNIQIKYDKPIKRPKAALEKISSELKDLRTPLYKLRSKFKKETSKTKADKLRKEIRKLEKAIDTPVDNLVTKRNEVKYLAKQFELVRKLKAQKRGKLKAIDKAIDKAEEDKDYKEMERLSFQKMKELGEIDNLNELLGMPVLKQEVDKYEVEEDMVKGFLEDDSNPIPVWVAAKVNFPDDRASGSFDWFIINGEKIPLTNIGWLLIEASTFWLTVKANGGKSPYVLRYYNLEKRIVKYVPYQ